jgi:O-antigen chain-terminating methyltransferase
MSDERFIGSPEGIEGWREVWRDDLRYPPRPGILGKLARTLSSLLLRASGEAARQRNFNIALLEMLSDVRGDMSAINANVARQVARVEELVPIAIRRGDALVAAVDRKVEGVAARIRDLSNPPAGAAAPSGGSSADFVYRRLEEALRGSEPVVRESAAHYLPFLREQQPVVDAGCGRGELLALCREEGIAAKGFDTNERSVADLVAKGLDASVGAIPGCFAGFESGSLGTIVAMHVVEHLPGELLFALFEEAARTLRPGGYLVIETPNAASVVVSATELWKDPTHLAPRHVAALVTLGRESGFDLAEASTAAPFPASDTIQVSAEATPEIRQLVARLNQLLFGDQNLRVVLRKR